MKTLLSRSHYTWLVVGAANIEPKSFDAQTQETGWATTFDGGGNIHSPNDFGAVLAEARWCEKEDDVPGVVQATIIFCHEGFAQNPNDKDNVSFFRCLQPEKLEGWEAFKKDFFESVPEDAFWEEISEKEVSKQDRKILRKTIETLKGLFSQGGDFFGVGESKEEERDEEEREGEAAGERIILPKHL